MRAVAGFLCGAWLLLGVIPEDSAASVQLFSCGFETDFCGMTQRTDDNFDWTRHSGGTETGDTGPASAYSGSFYIHIEATDVTPRNAAEVKTGSLQHSGTACVTFAYHIYGVGSGELAVTSTSSGEIWRAYANQGDHWRLGTAEVDLKPEDQVSFRAETSSYSRGDVALDDIVIRTGGCRTTEPLPFSCSFEEGFCGMLQSNDDNFDWTRFDRPTDTGPEEAADGTWFIYTETDGQRWKSNVAKVETPSIDFMGHVCVRFKYYMSGYYVGILRVHLVNVGTEKSIFHLGGDQGSEWQAAEINVTEIHSGDWLRFTGEWALVTWDIGVDDVLISPGLCNGCQVNNGGCDHICTGFGTCSCRQGYTLDGTNTCVDLNECTGSTDGCSDGCQNTLGSYRCTCPDGKLLGVDGVSCSDPPACPGFYGVNCSRPCHCANKAPCDPGTGVCPGGLCSPGWSGVACDQARCQNGTFGVGCTYTCHCQNEGPCDVTTGSCSPGDCADGWTGDDCSALGGQPDNSQGHSQVIVAVTVVVLAVIAFAVGVVVYIKRRKKVSQAQEQAVPSASPGDGTGPADVATYEDVGGPQPAKVNTSAIQMSPLRLHGAVPAPQEYLNPDFCDRRSTASYVNVPTGVYYENHAALVTRPPGDVTEPADGAAYDDVRGLTPVTARAAQIQMPPSQTDLEDPNPGGYEHLESYEPHVGGPYDVIM